MKQPPERRRDERAAGSRQNPLSRERSPDRTKRPGETGLANEARPGLGTRADDPDPAAVPIEPPAEAILEGKPRATPRGRDKPRPEPREQSPDSMAREQERSTGVSGHTGMT